MSALVKLLGSFAPGHGLDHEGKGYVFGRIDQRMKAALSVAYFKRAREAVYAIKGEVPADEYGWQLKAVLDAWRRGEYAFSLGSESFRYFIGEGLAELVTHLTGCTTAEALALVEARGVELLHVCLCLVYESMGEEDKKKLLSQENTRDMQQLVSTLLSRTNSSTNGSPSSKPTSAPTSPSPASILTSSPA